MLVPFLCVHWDRGLIPRTMNMDNTYQNSMMEQDGQNMLSKVLKCMHAYNFIHAFNVFWPNLPSMPSKHPFIALPSQLQALLHLSSLPISHCCGYVHGYRKCLPLPRYTVSQNSMRGIQHVLRLYYITMSKD